MLASLVLGLAAWLAFSLFCAVALLLMAWCDGSFAPEPVIAAEPTPATAAGAPEDLVTPEAA